jgi:hypothetical protein
MGDVHRLREDHQGGLRRDPAARTTWEVLTVPPGSTLGVHRVVVHPLWRTGLRWLARWLAIGPFWTASRSIPGAAVGRRVFIDHGMGVVIGETAEIGDDCDPLSRRHARGDVVEQRQAAPDARAQCRGRAGAKILGRSWWATARRSAPTRGRARTCPRAPRRSASRRASHARSPGEARVDRGEDEVLGLRHRRRTPTIRSSRRSTSCWTTPRRARTASTGWWRCSSAAARLRRGQGSRRGVRPPSNQQDARVNLFRH